MKRSLKRILSIAMAAAMMICSIPAEAPLKLLNPPDVVHADGYVSLSEKTGVLSLNGAFTQEQLWKYRENDKVTSIVANNGAILPQDCSSLFQSDSRVKDDNTLEIIEKRYWQHGEMNRMHRMP